jgi:hypothetical protein
MKMTKEINLKNFKMKNIFSSIIYLMVIALFSVSCDEDETTFTPLDLPADSFVAFEATSITVNENITSDIVIPVNIVTVNQTSDITIDFNISSDDAVLGTHYEIVDNKAQFSIASGEYSDEIIIRLIDNEDNETNKQLVIDLTSVSNGASLGYPGPDSFGKSFTLTIIDNDCPKDESLRPFDGTYSGTDNCNGFTTTTMPITLKLACEEGILIDGIGYAWMETYWGETVTAYYETYIEIDDVDGTVVIPDQKYIETIYNGFISDYNLVGSGTIDTSGPKPVINLLYTLTHPDYGNCAQYTNGNSCDSFPEFFEAQITLD